MEETTPEEIEEVLLTMGLPFDMAKDKNGNLVKHWKKADLRQWLKKFPTPEARLDEIKRQRNIKKLVAEAIRKHQANLNAKRRTK
jgi:hypothetical protein